MTDSSSSTFSASFFGYTPSLNGYDDLEFSMDEVSTLIWPALWVYEIACDTFTLFTIVVTLSE